MGAIYKIYLLLGSNKSLSFVKDGVRKSLSSKKVLTSVKSLLEDRFEIVAQSAIHRTSPVGIFDSEKSKKVSDFYNQVIVLETTLKPLKVLDIIQQIEIEFGRERDLNSLQKGEDKRVVKIYSSRTLDIDILKVYKKDCKGNFEQVIIDDPRLQVPHIQIETRPFVKPLIEEADSLSKGI